MSGTMIPMMGKPFNIADYQTQAMAPQTAALEQQKTAAQTGLIGQQAQTAQIANTLGQAQLGIQLPILGQVASQINGGQGGGIGGAGAPGPNGLPAPVTSSAGVNIPALGVGAVPVGVAGDLATGNMKKPDVINMKRGVISQVLGSAIGPNGDVDPDLYNQNIDRLYQMGWMDGADRAQYEGHPERAVPLLNSFAPVQDQPAFKYGVAHAEGMAKAQLEENQVYVPDTDENGQPTGTGHMEIRRGVALPGGGQGAVALPGAGGQGGGQGGASQPDQNQPRGLRNNNPLNLTGPGDAGADNGAGYSFGKYSSMENGVAANARQILTDYNTHGLTTLSSLIGDKTHGWSPDGAPGNPTGAAARYAMSVARALGVRPGDDIGPIIRQPGGMERLVMAMSNVENGGVLVDPGSVHRGVSMALAPPTAQPTQVAGPGAPPTVTPGTTPIGGGPPNPVQGVAAGPPQVTPNRQLTVGLDTDRAKADSKTNEDEQAQAQQLQRGQTNLFNIRNLADRVDAGALGDTRAALNNYFSTFGGDWGQKAASLIPGVDPSKAGSQQEFVKQTLMQAGQAERDALGARGGYSAIRLYQNAFPNLNMQPTAINDMSNLLLVAHQRDLDYLNSRAVFFNQNYDQFSANPAATRYTPLSQHDQNVWGINDPNSVHAPEVYVSAAALMNGHPPADAFKGLTPDQQVEALHIVSRTDPNAQAQIMARRGGG